MTICIAIAPHPTTAELAWHKLRSAGAQPAASSRRDGLAPADVHSLMLKTLAQRQQGAAPSASVELAQLGLERIWSELATDLLLANVDHARWGWHQVFDEHTPSFWAQFDPTVQFVLAYTSPLDHLVQALGSVAPDADLPQTADTVLSAWVQQHDVLLKQHYRLGHRSTLVPVQPAPPLPTDSSRALLAQVWAQHTPAVQLWAELQAASAEPCEEINCAAPNPLDLWQTLRQSAHLGQQAQQAVAKLETDLASAQAQVNQLQASLTQAQQAAEKNEAQRKQAAEVPAKVQQQLAEANEENELLLAQLHQVQEELEHYFLRYQSSEQNHRQQAQALQQTVDFWYHHTPAEIWIDARQPLQGQGWYEAEADGRWTGPETTSTLQLPAIAAGTYTLELHIIDTMHPDLIGDLQVAAVLPGHEPMALQLVHEFNAGGHLYPMACMGLLVLPELTQQWQLHISLPRTVSPAQRGGDDTRQLGVRVQGLRLSLNASGPSTDNV